MKKIFIYFLFIFLSIFPSFSWSKDTLSIHVIFHPKNYIDLEKSHILGLKNNILEFKKEKIKTNLIDNENRIYSSEIYLDGLGLEHFKRTDLLLATIKYHILDNSIFNGASEFRLLDPKPSYYDVPFIYNLFLDHFKLPKRNYSIIKFSTNISNKKYTKVFEESFGDSFLSRNNLQNGFLLKIFIYNRLGHETLKMHRNNQISDNEYLNIYYNNISSSNLKKYRTKNDITNAEFKKAKKIFKKYLNKEKKASEVFDIDSSVKVFFINKLWGEMHSILAHNIRFYFDPKDEIFYLIPSDPFFPMNIKEKYKNQLPLPFLTNRKNEFAMSYFHNMDLKKEWFQYLLEDSEFQSTYLNYLLNIDKLDLKNLINKIEKHKLNFSDEKNIKSIQYLINNIRYVLNYLDSSQNIKLINEVLIK